MPALLRTRPDQVRATPSAADQAVPSAGSSARYQTRPFLTVRRTYADVSFTAFVRHAVARAVAENRLLHAYRRRHRLVIVDDVDVNTQIEAEGDGQPIVQSLLARAANRTSLAELPGEIRAAQGRDEAAHPRYRGTLAFLRLPRTLRALARRVVLAEPTLTSGWGARWG